MKNCFFKGEWNAMYAAYVMKKTIPKSTIAKKSSANISNWYNNIPFYLKKSKTFLFFFDYTPEKGDLVFLGYKGKDAMGIVTNYVFYFLKIQ